TPPTGSWRRSSRGESRRSTRPCPRLSWRRRSLDAFEPLPEQAEAKRLLRAALAEGPAHAYLLHGPPGVGKRAAARAFAAELIGEVDRVLRDAHPDVYEIGRAHV